MANFDRAFEVDCISLNDKTGIFTGQENPTITGIVCPSGSIYLRHTETAQLWLKNGGLDTDWEIIATASDLTALSSAIDSNTSNINIISGDIANLSGAIDSNSTSIISLSSAIDGNTNNIAIISGDITNLSGAIDTNSSKILNVENKISSGFVTIDTNQSVSGEKTFVDNLTASSGFIANGITYPAIDGTSGQVVTTDGNGNLSFTTVSGSGGVEFIDDLGDVDTTTNIPVTGDFLRWNGSDWIPSSSPEITGIPVSNNLVWAYDTLIQTLSAINTFQIITFDEIVVAEGWTYSNGNFTSNTGGAFMATFEFNVEKNGGGNVEVTVKADKNNVEMAGSHNGMDVTSNNTAFSISRTFLFLTEPNDVINFKMAGNNTTARLVPAPVIGGITTPTGATLLIRRIV